MIRARACLAIAFAAASGCAASLSPVQPLADAEGASRAALEIGAANEPQAQLHLRLAQEQISRAKVLLDRGDQERASLMLLRAKADAELALELTRAARAEADEERASAQAAASHASTTTTTGAIVPAAPQTTPPPPK